MRIGGGAFPAIPSFRQDSRHIGIKGAIWAHLESPTRGRIGSVGLPEPAGAAVFFTFTQLC
ncbi:hypothetical protein WK32_31390 [Burkholderia vietnamiensis]|uniref:Uncharacterized protein n=1 Tax=Burkholderia vietnamiensis TaxID=60552 RepID=A0AA44XYE9_BURVI|nr:hypothetical protein WK32_31390 [Burkholderia vietnamiensis]PRH40445.1 hypothetical protein C6T65_20930 [Burkholderia vietnamiensis]